MAKNTADYDRTIDELADSIVCELADRMSRKPPDVDSACVEVSRLLRDALPALWEWSSQECEIKRLRTALQQIDDGHCLCPDKHDRSECLCWMWISQAALAEPVSQKAAESEEPKP